MYPTTHRNFVSLYIYISLAIISYNLYRPRKFEVFTKVEIHILACGFTTPSCRTVGVISEKPLALEFRNNMLHRHFVVTC